MYTNDEIEQIRHHHERRDAALYGFQRHLITVGSTVLGILVGLHTYRENNTTPGVAGWMFAGAILSMTLGIVLLSAANYSEIQIQNRLILARLGPKSDRPKFAKQDWYLIFAENAGYVLLTLGVMLIGAYSIARELILGIS